MKILLMLLAGLTVAIAQVPQYSVTMTPGDYSLLYTRDIFSDSLLPCSLQFQASSWNNAQVRFKGHSTRYYSKKSYRLKFASSNLFQGQGQINFNSMYTDKSFIREKLAWTLFADMNQIAPRPEYGRLAMNGVDKGLFLYIDKIDKNFLQRRGRTLAPMYEANDTYISADLTVQPDSLLKMFYEKPVGNVADYSDLARLIGALNAAPDSSFADTVQHYFDISTVLNWFSGNILAMMGDSYTKNYFLYRDTSTVTSQWNVIPWDYDLSFGRSGDPSIPYPASLLNDKFAYTYSPLSGPANVLKTRWLNTPALKQMLRQSVDTLLNTVFTDQIMHARIDSLNALLGNDVVTDPEKWGTYDEFREHAEALKYYVTARRNFLKKTFINTPSGMFNDVTLPIRQAGVPYHFVGADGRQIATLWFSTIFGLDSIQVRAYPNLIPSHIVNPGDGRYIRRWLRITPYPDTARFTATVRWEYLDAVGQTEVGSGVQNEHLLQPVYFDGATFTGLPGLVNTFGNFVTIDSVTEMQCTPVNYFALKIRDTYTQTWFRQPLNFWQRWLDIKFADQSRGFAVGEHGTILRTSDGGTTWTPGMIGFNQPFRRITMPAPDNMFVVGKYGSLFQSADSGNSWTRSVIATTNDVNDIVFPTPQTGWIVGAGRLILKTSDSGVQWNPSFTPGGDTLIAIAAHGDSSAVVFSRDGTVYRTLNSGQSWSTINVPDTIRWNASAAFGDSLIWATGDQGVTYHSTDRGETWSRSDVPVPVRLHGIAILDTDRVFVCGEAGRIFYTTNSGVNWYDQYTADAHDLYAISFVDTSHGFSVGNGGVVLETMSAGTVTDVHVTASGLPDKFELYQNYPNPFNPATQIRFSIAEQGFVSLRIYNLLGQELLTLVDGVLHAGVHTTTWNPTNMASGVYFYRLEVIDTKNTSKRSIRVNKMLLMR